MLWSSRRRSWISPEMALRCGSDGPEQTTKKSVKEEMPRRSMAMTSSAFLFAAYSATRVAKRSGLIRGSLVKVVVLDELSNFLGNEIPDGCPACNSRANLRGRDIQPPLDPAEAFGARKNMPAPEDDELHHGAQVRKAVPCRELGKMIFANQVEELCTGHF